MPRRTIYLRESTERLIAELSEEGESFSAALVRLAETGACGGGRRRPSYVGIASGPRDEIGRRAEEYLSQTIELSDERPADQSPR
ncbi:MAG: hypothetical protein H0W09_08065 [Solirubrobacterales bacterium]|nr:hypothetical protein [Solirubrobacterales bacterium]